MSEHSKGFKQFSLLVNYKHSWLGVLYVNHAPYKFLWISCYYNKQSSIRMKALILTWNLPCSQCHCRRYCRELIAFWPVKILNGTTLWYKKPVTLKWCLDWLHPQHVLYTGTCTNSAKETYSTSCVKLSSLPQLFSQFSEADLFVLKFPVQGAGTAGLAHLCWLLPWHITWTAAISHNMHSKIYVLASYWLHTCTGLPTLAVCLRGRERAFQVHILSLPAFNIGTLPLGERERKKEW